MKTNRLKIALSLFLAFAMVICFGSVAFAADSSITFNGPGSFAAGDLFDSFKGVLPGDKLNEKITIRNNSKDFDYIKVYLRALPHDATGNPISPAVLDKLTADERRGETSELDFMMDFLSQLSMRVSNDGEEIFSASPNEAGDLTSNVLLGELRKNESMSIDVELNVPVELDNKYAGRIGEVDWVFVVEGFDNIHPPFFDMTRLTVRKVWNDDGIDRPSSITAQLYRDGKLYDEVELSAENQWTHSWDKMSRLSKWTVEEKNVPEGYDVAYKTEGSFITIVNTKRTVIEPKEEFTSMTVNKVWNDDGVSRPDSVTVSLKNGDKVIESIELNEENKWTYTWDKLSKTENWSVVETEVPEGYTATYINKGQQTTIVNTKPVQPAVEYDSLTVYKMWDDDGKTRPASVTACLIQGDKVVDEVQLSESNQWTYTWNKLEKGQKWSVIEKEIPAGYEASYKTEGSITAIINTLIPIPVEPVNTIDLTVLKEWEDNGKNRPDSVKVTLYNGESEVETVGLGEWNNWTYTWRELDGNGDWQVIETAIPKGYVPEYTVDGSTVHIKNIANLAQTGQLSWPIPILGGLGLLLVTFGTVTALKKRKEDHVEE